VTLTAAAGRRVMFVLPAASYTIIGHRHLRRDAPEDVHATRRDVTYPASANHYFPDAHLRSATCGDVGGIRPLAAHGRDRAPSSASREHSIVESVPGSCA
jgi:glycerol-3-phosphate dehydrogenase